MLAQATQDNEYRKLLADYARDGETVPPLASVEVEAQEPAEAAE